MSHLSNKNVISRYSGNNYQAYAPKQYGRLLLSLLWIPLVFSFIRYTLKGEFVIWVDKITQPSQRKPVIIFSRCSHPAILSYHLLERCCHRSISLDRRYHRLPPKKLLLSVPSRVATYLSICKRFAGLSICRRFAGVFKEAFTPKINKISLFSRIIPDNGLMKRPGVRKYAAP